MIRFFYDLSLFALLVLFFPKLLLDYFFKKKYRQSLFARLNPHHIQGVKKPVIWLHAVSVGETKALSTLIPHIKQAHPDAFLFITTVTETGQATAKRLIPEADSIYYLPLDFSWIIRGFVRALKPDLLLLVEGDYWFNLLHEVKRYGGKIVVVNGKLSEKSLNRYLSFRSFSQHLFSSVDYFCLQAESYLERFLMLGIPPEKLSVTGNLKFDIPGSEPDAVDELRKKLNIQSKDRVITLGSTHEGEEELLLKILEPFLDKDPHLKVLVVPRHSERFKKVRTLMRHPQAILVDQMGALPACYRLSYIAIVGGSFVRGIGGHDIFEPAKIGVPVLYGPYMDKQTDLDHLLTESGAGRKVLPKNLHEHLEELLTPSLHDEMAEKGKELAQEVAGAAFRTWNLIDSNIYLEKKS